MPGLMQELNLKPGVIYGEDVLNVRPDTTAMPLFRNNQC